MSANKFTCHYFNEETGEFLFSRERIPECGVDFCAHCGDCLDCFPGECFDGEGLTQHYWEVYVEGRYV